MNVQLASTARQARPVAQSQSYISCNTQFFVLKSVAFSCRPGRYNQELASSSCAQCPSGQFQAIARQLSCKLCGVGKFTHLLAKVENTHCKLCSVGKYQGKTGGTQCTACPGGYFGKFSASCHELD